MRILRFIQGGEFVQLGIEKKVLFLKWGHNMFSPIRLGELKEIKKLSTQKNMELNGQKMKVPLILQQMSKSITSEGLKLADKMNDEEFYQDFVNDHKELANEGSLNWIGVFDKWE